MAPLWHIVVSGPIGCGKTTLLNRVEQEFVGQSVRVLCESVHQWLDPGFPILKLFYQDPARWAFTFQQLVLMSLRKQHAEARREGIRVLVTERSALDGLHIFLELQRRKGHVSQAEFDAHRYFYEATQCPEEQTYQFLVRCGPEECFRRLQNRGGVELSSASYLAEINRMYQEEFRWDSILLNETPEDLERGVHNIGSMIEYCLDEENKK